MLAMIFVDDAANSESAGVMALIVLFTLQPDDVQHLLIGKKRGANMDKVRGQRFDMLRQMYGEGMLDKDTADKKLMVLEEERLKLLEKLQLTDKQDNHSARRRDGLRSEQLRLLAEVEEHIHELAFGEE